MDEKTRHALTSLELKVETARAEIAGVHSSYNYLIGKVIENEQRITKIEEGK